VNKTFLSGFFITFLFLVSSFFVPVNRTQASTGAPYFGGIVTVEYACNTGLLVYVKDNISVVPPVSVVVPYMWLWGELPFLSYIPPHPGQELLGIALPVTVPCILGYVPIGAGFPIVYHGSSL